MSKVFFFNIPFHGHVNPSLGLVRELVNRGEEVIYYCIDSFKEKIESTGATYRSYGKKFFLNENFVTYNITDIIRVHLELSELILEDLYNDIMREKPDYIIHDSLCTWAKHVAMISGIPAVNTMTTLVMVPDGVLLTINYLIGLAFVTITNASNMRRISNIAKALKRKYNIDVKSLVDTLENKEKLNIVYTSKEFQPKSGKLMRDYRFIGPASMYRNEVSTDFGFDNKESRILLFISMGSIFNNNIDFFNKCVEAFGNMNISVLMSVGNSIDITSLKVPDNFSVKYYYDIPQLEVLKKCDVFITHGGMNSTHEGLFNGIPLIIIPQQDEQSYVAKQVVRSGSGICLNRAKVTPKVLKESVKKVTTDKSFRINALKMRASFISAGGPERAAKEIFTFVGNKTGTDL